MFRGLTFLGHSVQRCRVCVCVAVWITVDQLDMLLDCQKPSRTAADTHDEHLLIVTHQGHYMRTH